MNELTAIGPRTGGGVQRIFVSRVSKKHLLLRKMAVLPLKMTLVLSFKKNEKKV
jgi:hypothetical protein